MTLQVELENRIRRLALDNAIRHDGVAQPDPIVSRLLAAEPELRARAAEVGTLARTIAEEVSSLPRELQSARLSELGGAIAPGPRVAAVTGQLPDLPGAEAGKVVLRMAPFPSGALHIGHARMVFVNDYYRKQYDGRLLLVFDDTIGSEEKRVETEFFQIIEEDLGLCGVRPDAVYYKSDRLERHYEWAERVIARGAAYVCVCPADQLRENRRLGRACPERAQSVEQTRGEWRKMLAGGYQPGEAVLRMRTDLLDPDPAFRDRVLFRISDLDHPRVGRKYRVWPLLEFSWAVDDVELGVTHVIRGKDLVIEDRMEEFIWKLLGVRGPPFLHWGILRIREAKISKSKGFQEVRSGAYDGWSDPRLWSLRSLDRRGITTEALRRFVLSFGLSLADIEVPAETLYAENRAIVDPTTPRRAFVPDPVRVRVAEYPSNLARLVLPNHPERAELGTRTVTAGPDFWLPGEELRRHAGEEIRLKDLVNVQLPPTLATSEETPLAVRFTTRENKRLLRIQWVSTQDSVPVDLLNLDGSHRVGRGEAALATALPGDRLQLERVGFVRLEADWTPGRFPVRACYGHP